MVLVGNKCDLEEERVVGKDLGKGLANQFNCAFMETSAKAKINVNDVSQRKDCRCQKKFNHSNWNSIWIYFQFSQIFYDLVRQINKKSPEKKQKQKKKTLCVLL